MFVLCVMPFRVYPLYSSASKSIISFAILLHCLFCFHKSANYDISLCRSKSGGTFSGLCSVNMTFPVCPLIICVGLYLIKESMEFKLQNSINVCT